MSSDDYIKYGKIFDGYVESGKIVVNGFSDEKKPGDDQSDRKKIIEAMRVVYVASEEARKMFDVWINAEHGRPITIEYESGMPHADKNLGRVYFNLEYPNRVSDFNEYINYNKWQGELLGLQFLDDEFKNLGGGDYTDYLQPNATFINTFLSNSTRMIRRMEAMGVWFWNLIHITLKILMEKDMKRPKGFCPRTPATPMVRISAAPLL